MAASLTPAQQTLVSETARLMSEASPCGGERGELVRKLADALGISLNTAYVYLRKFAGYESGKKPRRDKGTTAINEKVCRMVSGMVLEGKRANGKRTMSVKLAVDILRANGMEIVENTQTVRRAMNLYGCHPNQLGNGIPAGRMRSLYPNHVWQIDASVCILYYPPNGTVGILDERKFNAKKPDNLEKIKAQRVIRYIATDHFSGAFYLLYQKASGENATGIIRTLVNFMADRGHNDPAHGIPEILYTDNGSGNLSSLVKGFCEQLGIKALTHLPNRANATGSVEQAQNLVECQFESRLRFLENDSVEALQKTADEWRRHYLANVPHTRAKKTRNAIWLGIPENRLKTVSREVLEAIAHWKDERRPVGNDFTISVNTRTSFGTCRYDLRELAYHGLNVRDTVRVRLNPFNVPDITAIMTLPDGTEKLFDVKPIAYDEAGQSLSAPVFGENFKSLPKTKSERTLEKIKAEAYGAETVEEAEKLKRKGKKAFEKLDIMADVKAPPLYLGRTGNPLKVRTHKIEVMPVNRIEFAMRMKREHPEIWNDQTSTECMEWLVARYPSTIPGEETERIIKEMAVKFEAGNGAIHAFTEGKRWAG